jgi:hypothetical protein
MAVKVTPGAARGRGVGVALKVDVLYGGKLFFDKKALQRILMAGGREVAAQARTLIGRKLSASQLRKGVRNKVSVAGTAPNSKSGLLRKSIVTKALRRGKLGARVFDTVEYAKYLETGASGGGFKGGSGKRKRSAPPTGNRFMQPHPFLSTAMNMKRPSIDRRVKAAINDGVAWVKEP